VFCVQDNGVGIEPHFHEQILGLFKRHQAGAETSGSGMGLPICQQIIARAGSRIWVESALGRAVPPSYFAIPDSNPNSQYSAFWR
jgi:light-regulated signal transduction histidine kinase (bacteriophytochrome)